MNTSVAQHISLISEMQHAVLTIAAFERMIERNKEKILSIGNITSDSLKKSYEDAIYNIKIRILEEQGIYYNALNRLLALSFSGKHNLSMPVLQVIPELPIIECDDDVESIFHKKTCGFH